MSLFRECKATAGRAEEEGSEGRQKSLPGQGRHDQRGDAGISHQLKGYFEIKSFCRNKGPW